MDIEGKSDDPNVKQALRELRRLSKSVTTVGGPEVPWFPTQVEDFVHIGKKILSEGEGIQEADHPGFRDPTYRKRRDEITAIALGYDLKDREIPRITYSAEERKVWKFCYSHLMKLY